MEIERGKSWRKTVSATAGQMSYGPTENWLGKGLQDFDKETKHPNMRKHCHSTAIWNVWWKFYSASVFFLLEIPLFWCTTMLEISSLSKKIIGKIATLTVRSFISCIEASVECIGKWCWVRKPKRSRLCRSTHKPRGRYWFFSLHPISLSSSWTAPLCQRKLFERSMAALTEKATEEVKNTNHFQIRNGKQIVDIDSLYQSYGTI